MCHHTREPAVLSRVSCLPFHLNIDRFHQPCLLPGRTSRIGEDCRPRTTWRPLTLCGQPGSPSFASHWRFFATPTRRYHGRTLIRPSSPACANPKSKGVCTHAGSESAAACFGHALGDPSPWPSKEMISDSVELCETEVCFLHIQLIGTNV